MQITVRNMQRPDIPAALALMRSLAVFEGYIDDFAADERALSDRGFGENPVFTCHLAFADEEPAGLAVTYVVEWTYDLKPMLVLKELFIAEKYRGSGAGRLLFEAVRQKAIELGAGRIRWLVLAGNDAAKGFYRKQGAQQLPQWEQWEVAL